MKFDKRFKQHLRDTRKKPKFLKGTKDKIVNKIKDPELAPTEIARIDCANLIQRMGKPGYGGQ